jgi:hypothetical protein
MKDFYLPDNYYDPQEELLTYAHCLKCDWWEVRDDQPEVCPNCGCSDLELDQDYF